MNKKNYCILCNRSSDDTHLLSMEPNGPKIICPKCKFLLTVDPGRLEMLQRANCIKGTDENPFADNEPAGTDDVFGAAEKEGVKANEEDWLHEVDSLFADDGSIKIENTFDDESDNTGNMFEESDADDTHYYEDDNEYCADDEDYEDDESYEDDNEYYADDESDEDDESYESDEDDWPYLTPKKSGMSLFEDEPDDTENMFDDDVPFDTDAVSRDAEIKAININEKNCSFEDPKKPVPDGTVMERSGDITISLNIESFNISIKIGRND